MIGQAHHVDGRGDGDEDAAGRLEMMPPHEQRAGRSQADTQPDFVAGNHRLDDIAARTRGREFGESERHRDRERTRVQMCGAMNVVELEPVTCRGADANGLAGAGAERAADDARARIAALFDRLVDQHPRPRLRHAEEAAGQRIAKAYLRLLDHVRRKVFETQLRRKGRKLRRLAHRVIAYLAQGDAHNSSRDDAS
jgi:hypothetical protein